MSNGKKEKIGSVYYDKNNKKWRCSYYIIDQDTMQEKRKYKSFFTEKEAKDFLTSIQYQKGNDLFIQNNGIQLSKLMYENAQKKLDMNLIGERTYTRIVGTIKTIEKSLLGNKNIIDVTSNDIQEYLNSLKNYSNSTIKKIKEQFSQIFREAINKGYITKNPMYGVITPRSTQERKPVRALTIDEQQKFTSYLLNVPISEEPFKVIYLIQMYLGLRIGEVLALKNSDINLYKNLVSVNKTLTTDINSKIVIRNATKTYAGIREVPIPLFIRKEVLNQMQRAESNKDKLLFLNPKGEFVRPNTVNKKLKELLIKIGIEGITTHSLRHTFGTRCIEAGMRAVALQRLMGHTDVSVTLNTYTSVFNKYKESELEKVNNYYLDNEIINSISNNKLDLYNLSPNDWKVIEDETARVKSEYNLLTKDFSEMNEKDIKEFEKLIVKYQKEIKLLKEKLKNNKIEKNISDDEK